MDPEKKPVEVYAERAETKMPDADPEELKALALAYAKYLAEHDIKPGDPTFTDSIPEEVIEEAESPLQFRKRQRQKLLQNLKQRQKLLQNLKLKQKPEAKNPGKQVKRKRKRPAKRKQKKAETARKRQKPLRCLRRQNCPSSRSQSWQPI